MYHILIIKIPSGTFRTCNTLAVHNQENSETFFLKFLDTSRDIRPKYAIKSLLMCSHNPYGTRYHGLEKSL